MNDNFIKLDKKINKTSLLFGIMFGYLLCRVHDLSIEVEELHKENRDLKRDLKDIDEALNEWEEEESE